MLAKKSLLKVRVIYKKINLQSLLLSLCEFEGMVFSKQGFENHLAKYYREISTQKWFSHCYIKKKYPIL